MAADLLRGGWIDLSTFRVAVARCQDYDPGRVGDALSQLLAGIGWEQPPAPGLHAFIKPNLLMARVPEHSVTTHPAVIAAVGRALVGQGYRVRIGDSPGGPFTPAVLKRLYEVTGMAAAARDCGGELSVDTSDRLVEACDVPVQRTFSFVASVLDADLLASVSKLKTHGLTGLTAAVKNLFGCVPGFEKTRYHMNQPSVESFSEVLVDITRTLSPAINICDAVVAMEGAGPSHGRPKHMGLLFASRDAFALDYAIARVMGVGPDGFTTLAASLRRGYGPQDDDHLEIRYYSGPEKDAATETGASAIRLLKTLRPAEFELLRPENLTGLQGRGRTRRVLQAIQPFLRSRPVFSRAICNRCGTCVRSCPAEALKIVDGLPQVDLQKCIRCYCCQELCPHGAVTIRRPLLYQLLYRR